MTAAQSPSPPIDELPYESLLRALGNYLDQHSAVSIRLIEVPDGWESYYWVRDNAGARTVVFHVSHQDLGSRPTHRGRHGDRHYEDMLRALGHELERLRASMILVDQVDSGLLVTYQYSNPGDGYLLRKRLSSLNSRDLAALIGGAHGRRRSHGWWSLLGD